MVGKGWTNDHLFFFTRGMFSTTLGETIVSLVPFWNESCFFSPPFFKIHYFISVFRRGYVKSHVHLNESRDVFSNLGGRALSCSCERKRSCPPPGVKILGLSIFGRNPQFHPLSSDKFNIGFF